ncbi:hypothetical protein [Haloferax volcanii]|uniref:hypothetical protein n=1 Tax=Haloferax volcanii TaxID=2246 RepID=UPI0012681457|nr:hypothetical protein [Haloferax alexandrinus]
MAVHTLPVASLLLFTSLFVFSNITDTKLIDRLVYLTGICVIIAYNTVVFDWIGKVFLKFSVAITTINYNSPSVFISSLSTSAGLYPGLKALGHSFTVNSLYSHAITYSNVLALSLVGFLFAYRLYVILSQKSITEMSQLDNLLGAFGIQGFAGVAILPLFAASGGFSPLTLGLIIAPLFGSISLYLIFKRIWSTDTTNTLRIGLIIVILIAVVAPAFVAFSYKPMSDGQISFSTTPENKAQITWTGSYTKQDQRVFSDFNSLSRYYAIIGPGKTYIPPTGSPAYSTEETAGKVIEYYYEDPASVQVEANVYLVSHQMIDQSMFHLGAITTEPNPELDEQLSRSGDWNKVYSTGKDYTFVTG